MRTRFPILALLCLLASLLVPGIASAHSATGAENRVWAFDLQGEVHVAGQHALTPGLHQGCELADYDSASGSLLAAKGGLRKGLGNIGSHGPMSADDALGNGQNWLGKGYKEVGPSGSGVFRSADGSRQFRMAPSDLAGSHGDLGPHIHFEALNPQGKVIENLHIPLVE